MPLSLNGSIPLGVPDVTQLPMAIAEGARKPPKSEHPVRRQRRLKF
jgi:hypothetical protein